MDQVTVLDLLVELRSLLSNQQNFHEEAARRAARGLTLLSTIEARFGFPSDRPVRAPKSSSSTADQTASVVKQKNGTHPPEPARRETPKKRGKKKPLLALLERANAQSHGAIAAAGPKLGGAKSAGTKRAVQLSPTETKVFRSLEAKSGSVVSTKDLARQAGLHPYTKIYTVIHRLRGKGYKIQSADEARRKGDKSIAAGLRGYRLIMG